LYAENQGLSLNLIGFVFLHQQRPDDINQRSKVKAWDETTEPARWWTRDPILKSPGSLPTQSGPSFYPVGVTYALITCIPVP